MKLQITFEKEALEMIDELKNKTGVEDRATVLVDAIELYRQIEKIADEDGNLILGKNRELELVIPRPKK